MVSLWGKVVGGVAGFAVGGPVGAVMGAALGHAADEGVLPRLGRQVSERLSSVRDWGEAHTLGSPLGTARVAAMFGQRDQLFAIGVVALSAKLAKCDGPVQRAEIDSFKSLFRIRAENVRETGRLFDQARDSPESFEIYAAQLGEAFPDNLGMLEDVLHSLFQIARADGPVNAREREFLLRVHRRFGLDRLAWERASGARGGRNGGPRSQGYAGRGDQFASPPHDDAYEVLGVTRAASNDELRGTWKRLMRENHPDSLAARGVPPEFIARASEKVARINAAWDVIKRERGL